MVTTDLITKWKGADFPALVAERGAAWLQEWVLADLAAVCPKQASLWVWEKESSTPRMLLRTRQYSPEYDLFYLHPQSKALDELWKIGGRLARLEVTLDTPDRYVPGQVVLTASGYNLFFAEEDNFPWNRLILKGMNENKQQGH